MSRRPGRWWRRRVLVVAAMGLVFAVLVPGAADAHTELTASVPGPRDRLQEPPRTVYLQFNEAVSEEFATVTVKVGDGDPVDLAARVDKGVVAAKVPARLRSSKSAPAQRWRVAYRVVSDDGHPVTGTVSFRVAAQNAPAQGTSGGVATDPTEPGAQPTPGSGDVEAGAAEPSDPAGLSGRQQTDYLPMVIAALAALGSVGSVVWLVRGRRRDQRESRDVHEARE